MTHIPTDSHARRLILHRRARRAWLAWLAAAAAGLTGCSAAGSGSGSGSAPGAKARVSELVRLARTHGGFQPSLTAYAGDTVEFLSVVHHGRGTAVVVTLHITQGPGGMVSLTAGTAGHTSTATISNGGHSPLFLTAIRYFCALPPEPSFCPVQHLQSAHNGYQFQFTTSHKASIEIEAKLAGGLGPPAKKPHRTTSAPVPPYKVIEDVSQKVTSQGTQVREAPLRSTLAVHPGDVVALETRVISPISGAPQPVTISFARGPARSITVTASVPGSTPSRATLSGAGGSTIAIDRAHFSCFLPSYPTFCPPTSSSFGPQGNRLTFQASPDVSPLLIVARIK